MLKTAQFDCSAINEKCCSVDGEQGIYSDSFFVPTPGDLTAQESPSTTTTTTTTSLFLTLNIQISHHLQIARLIEAGGV